ncbi:MAG: chorismate mutase [Rhodospirillales bacterium]
MAKKQRTLDELRAEIDRIDAELHQLMIARAAVADEVRHAKGEPKISVRPAREARILYTLVERHTGAFPKPILIKIWRELMAGMLSLEGPFFVAVYCPENEAGYIDLARDQYGTFTPLSRHATVSGVIDAVRNEDASLGILPFPNHDGAAGWWRHLMTPDSPKVVCRLPFFGPANTPGSQLEAMVICKNAAGESGRDRSLIAFELSARVSLGRLRSVFEDHGLPAEILIDRSKNASDDIYLADIEGYVEADDERLVQVNETLKDAIGWFAFLGAYGTPLTAEELASDSAVRRGVDRRRKPRESSDRRTRDVGVAGRKSKSAAQKKS